MADTQKKFDDIIRKIALVVKLVNEEIDDEPIESEVNELNDEISDLTCDIIDEKNDFVELKDLKNYLSKVIGKDYFADKREWSYLYDSVYDVYKDMNNILEEEMQTGLGMAQQLPTNSTYYGGIFDIYNNDEEEKKDMDKRLKESFKAPKDWDFDDMLKQYGIEYLSENSSDSQDCVNYMEDLQYIMESQGLEWLLDRLYYGGQWIRGDFNTKETFDHHEEYFVVNGYGNFYSLSDYYLDDYVKDTIENVYGEEEFYNWCVEQGYFESDEDNE